jgi:hypothetical protein
VIDYERSLGGCSGGDEFPARGVKYSTVSKLVHDGGSRLSSWRGKSNRKSKCQIASDEGRECDATQRQPTEAEARPWCEAIGQVLGIRAPAAFIGQASCRQHAGEPQHAAPMPGSNPAKPVKLMHPKDASNTKASIRRRIEISWHGSAQLARALLAERVVQATRGETLGRCSEGRRRHHRHRNWRTVDRSRFWRQERPGNEKCFRSRSQEPRFRPFGFSRSRRKGDAFKNLAGALHSEAVRFTSSVGREVETENPA